MVPRVAAVLQELVPAAEVGPVLVVTGRRRRKRTMRSRASCSALAAPTRGAAASIPPESPRFRERASERAGDRTLPSATLTRRAITARR